MFSFRFVFSSLPRRFLNKIGGWLGQRRCGIVRRSSFDSISKSQQRSIMANSLATLSKRLYRSLISNSRISESSMSFCTNNISSREESDLDELSANLDTESPIESKVSNPGSRFSGEERVMEERPHENGLDSEIYKAILVGQVGQLPLQKKLKSGRSVTLFSVGTGGIRNNRRPLINEDPREYASWSTVQWHHVSVYPERLADLVLKNVEPGSGFIHSAQLRFIAAQFVLS